MLLRRVLRTLERVEQVEKTLCIACSTRRQSPNLFGEAQNHSGADGVFGPYMGREGSGEVNWKPPHHLTSSSQLPRRRMTGGQARLQCGNPRILERWKCLSALDGIASYMKQGGDDSFLHLYGLDGASYRSDKRLAQDGDRPTGV